MSRGTLDPAGLLQTSDTGLSPSLAGCPNAVLLSFADPFLQSEPRDARITVWALPLSLAATDGIDTIFLFLRVLRCFNSPGLAPLQKQSGTTMQLVVGSPIQKSAGRSSHPAHRSLSQVVASFIACRCQGIHCTP